MSTFTMLNLHQVTDCCALMNEGKSQSPETISRHLRHQGDGKTTEGRLY